MSSKNYTVYHCHDAKSNLSTGIDSVTKVKDYVEQAVSDGMASLGISNHGNVFQWYNRKKAIEGAGLKYIHAEEFYLTSDKDMENRKMDNYHTVLISKNYEGFLELNKLSSLAYTRDHHFYGKPRITFEELFGTSDNIIVTSACIASPLACEFNHYTIRDKKTKEIIRTETRKERLFGDDEEAYNKMVEDYIIFLSANKERCFLEVQHHNTREQRDYNRYLLKLSAQTGIPIIAGTDTHCLNERHERGRKVLQYRKDIFFEEEDGWDLTWKNYDELVEAYKIQNVIPIDMIESAIENTNVMADMVEPFELDSSFKYPNIYDSPDDVLRNHVFKKAREHRYLNSHYDWNTIEERLNMELETFKTCKSSNYILLQEYFIDWCKEQGFHTGPGRGSCVGSLACYVLGVTEVDPIKHGLIFSRFMSPSRITLADIDIDISSEERPFIEKFVVGDHLNIDGIESAVIMTENTIDWKGAIKDVCGGLLNMYKKSAEKGLSDEENPYTRYKKYDVDYAQKLSDSVSHDKDGKAYIPDDIRKSEPEVFEYVDVVRGTCISLGVHASGKLIADRDITAEIGTCTSKDSDYRLTVLDMEELEAQYWVKEDLLGLNNLGVINNTCKRSGIDIIKPETLDTEDMEVWNAIRDNTTSIFQFDGGSAKTFLKNFLSKETIEIAKKNNPNFNMIDWVAIANAALRPASASYRDALGRGEIADNGWSVLNDFLAETNGYLVYQEQIMKFLVEFCGYSEEESDVVRRKIAHKGGTHEIIPEIKKRFIETGVEKYGLDEKNANDIVEPFLKIITDASRYAFNKSHAVAYTYISYECGYLRKYKMLEFISESLNVFAGNEEKTNAILEYARIMNVKNEGIKYGYSKAEYFFDRETQTIYKGVASVKYMNKDMANTLYQMSKMCYNSFTELLIEIKRGNVADSRQLNGLIQLDYFSQFGNSAELMRIKTMVENFKYGNAKEYSKEKVPEDSYLYPLFQKYATGTNKDGTPSKKYKIMNCMKILIGIEAAIRKQGIEDYGFAHKIAIQQEFLGYISLVSGKEADRPKLYINKITNAKAKASGNIFGKRIFCCSIGSGKESMFTIPLNGKFNYKTKKRDPSPWDRCGPVKEGDIIYVKNYKTNKLDDGRIFYDLLDYEIVIE